MIEMQLKADKVCVSVTTERQPYRQKNDDGLMSTVGRLVGWSVYCVGPMYQNPFDLVCRPRAIFSSLSVQQHLEQCL